MVVGMFGRIVVGTDGSETAGTAVDRAIGLAASLQGRLLIVSAFGPIGEWGEHGRAEPADAHWMPPTREDVFETLRDAGERARRAGVPVETFARQGDPADAILDVAEEQGADLVVVGNKGMTGAKRFLLGSVPNKVSHHAPCSVLIIRTG
jgi:nucleotide-binding universal stress UspA family protein